MHDISRDEILGLLRPAIDAHTLGLSSVSQLLEDCNLRTIMADASICDAVGTPSRPGDIIVIEQWIRQNSITRLGFSYRLDPTDGASIFGRLLYQMRDRYLLSDQGGPIRSIYFAGLPQACDLVQVDHRKNVVVFYGDETPSETLDKLGVPQSYRPNDIVEQAAYDNMLLDFGKKLIACEKHLQIKKINRSGYDGFGARHDMLINRIRYCHDRGELPLFRAHVGPYLPNRFEAVQLYLCWCQELAQAGLLDILSIGTSQLSQSNFGEDWDDKPNGGGVPINSPLEYRAVWDAARPMLVRTYAGTNNMLELAHLYERTINNAWHAFSLWWFSKIDGRGPLSVYENLQMHLETLKFVAQKGKPYEPNVSHHFAFRGCDDVTYIVSAVLAARLAKRSGVRYLVLQNMLNTPKCTWGIQDLAKSRALLVLVRELEDSTFKVYFQPRAGLNFFSHKEERAKAQLAAVTAMMDDIEPCNLSSPEIIHVVNYTEGSRLADPRVVNDSICITRAALNEYRRQRKQGDIPDMSCNLEVEARERLLLQNSRMLLSTMEKTITDLYTAKGLYTILACGFFPVPYLWECRDEFEHAVHWRTRCIRGGVSIVDEFNRPIPIKDRLDRMLDSLNNQAVIPSSKG